MRYEIVEKICFILQKRKESRRSQMKKSKMYIFILLAIGLMAISPLNAFSQGKPIELRLAHMFPVGSPSHQHMEQWAKKIAADSNGRLTIRIFPSNTLIGATEMYSGVAKGAADIGFAWRYKPEGYAIGVLFPFLLGAPDTVTAGRVYDDIWKEFPKVMAEEWKDVKILYLVPSMPVYLFARKPLLKIEDIKGLQLRVPSRELADLTKELGAAPAFMSAADFVIGLDKGTVDGACALFGLIPDYKLGGKVKYVLMHNLGVSTPLMLVMNKDSFNKLPADLKGVLDKSSEWGKNDAIKYWSDDHENAIKYCKAEGIELITLSQEERAKWNAVVERGRDKVAADLDAKGYPGTEILRFIRKRIEHYAR
jgi:TRAP-type C4-dicarboxylate transport system substrate-binding protein